MQYSSEPEWRLATSGEDYAVWERVDFTMAELKEQVVNRIHVLLCSDVDPYCWQLCRHFSLEVFTLQVDYYNKSPEGSGEYNSSGDGDSSGTGEDVYESEVFGNGGFELIGGEPYADDPHSNGGTQVKVATHIKTLDHWFESVRCWVFISWPATP
jgi:hypothetical protein